jgi:hypothetical protein
LEEIRTDRVRWYQWGPFLSARQWGTVREDYSAGGSAWDEFPHDHARSRAYRWGEDGILGICDHDGYLCLAPALWNGADPILKERFFGLAGPEGNHGEDIKEYYFFLDATPTHSYLKALYKYPQRAYPYADLVAENRRRSRRDPEFELLDTGIFGENRYFDVTVEYAKAEPSDIVVAVSVVNRGPEAATLHLLPTLWFRNTWSWGRDERRPTVTAEPAHEEGRARAPLTWIRAEHHVLGEYWLACEGRPGLLFTENESNAQRLWGVPSRTAHVKDAFHEYVVRGNREAVSPEHRGTKAAAHYVLTVPAAETAVVRLRLTDRRRAAPLADADEVLAARRQEAEEFYAGLAAPGMTAEERRLQRQAFAGLLWSEQFYFYDVAVWLDGDPAGPRPPEARLHGRNAAWRHLNNADVISMPDTWEYPWYAAWDLAFHCIPLAMVDPEFAKRQLVLLLREWYMHPNGQLPAYEWAFGDVNPPVHAWAARRVYELERERTGRADRTFLERIFHKLLLNFTWWVNRKDAEGRNVFQGGFLGLDNIGVFDRSRMLPVEGHLDQSDGTAWMGMFCLEMLAIALELARGDPAYEDVCTKFFEHFLYIAGALNDIGGEGIALWDDGDEFFYDVLHRAAGESERLRIRSLVGLIPLLAVLTIEPDVLQALPNFQRRMQWFLTYRPQLAALVSRWHEPGVGDRRLLALARGHRMKRLLRRMLDPNEFLSPYGVRSVSRWHRDHPYTLRVDGQIFTCRYEPGESQSGVFGGNSNWRGPIWFPINYLLIEALDRFHRYYGDDFRVECPTGSGQLLTLRQIADEISARLIRIFLCGPDGRRPVFGGASAFQDDPHWRDHLLFFEYFHGDSGAGLGASHQTGWTALVAELLHRPRSTLR